MKWKNRKPKLSDELERLKTLDPYEVLNISESASIPEIKDAYRRLVKIYHPDKSTPFMRNHNEQVIKIINDAYKRLMHSENGDIK